MFGIRFKIKISSSKRGNILKIIKCIQINWYEKGQFVIKKKKKNPQERKEEKTNLIESLTSMIWFRQNQFLRNAQLANILSHLVNGLRMHLLFLPLRRRAWPSGTSSL